MDDELEHSCFENIELQTKVRDLFEHPLDEGEILFVDGVAF